MKRILSFPKSKCLLAGVAVLAVSAAVLAWPAIARCEAVTIEQEKERGRAVTDMPDPIGPPDRISVLVHVKPGAGRGPIHAFAAGAGGIVKYEYKTVLPSVMNLRNIPVKAKAALEKIPGVVRVVEDKYHEKLIKLDESTPLIRGLQSQISSAGHSADGSGVRICVCDTGIDTDHIMYSDRIDFGASYDFYNDDANPEDDHGHGSHVAGIAVGGTGLSVDFGCEGAEEFQGVAPNATLIGVKILNMFGGGFDSDIIAGINHCADPNLKGGSADVINLSIGTGEYSGPCDHSWAVAANNAVAAGVVVVAASGNENYTNALSSPACGSDVIAVGATYKNNYPNCEDDSTSTFNWSNCSDFSPIVDDIACFSNESDYLDVTAPGAVIWSASTASGGSTITGMSGTSMAAPHVAGLAALILSADPTLTPVEVRQIIRDSAIDMGTYGFDPTYGYGRIDVVDSLSLISPCNENPDCDDGLFCNGEEKCSSGDCQQGQDPCPGVTCNENADVCIPLVCDEDGICEQGEDCNNCPFDCISGGKGGVCGNGVCEPSIGEDCLSCAADCGGKQVGAAKKQYCCGDGAGTNPVGCADSRCTTEGFECGSAPSPYCCGDELCDPGEDQCSCQGDCGTPPSTETGYCFDGLDNDCDNSIDGNDSDCECLPRKKACTEDAECCSSWCHRGACK